MIVIIINSNNIIISFPMPIYVSRTHFALRYEVPKFLPRGGHLCMAMLTIAAVLHGAAQPRCILLPHCSHFQPFEIRSLCPFGTESVNFQSFR